MMSRVALIALGMALGGCAGVVRKVDPERAKDLRAQGDEAYRKRNYQAAVTYYTASIEANPDAAEAYYARANATTFLEEAPDGTPAQEFRQRALDDYTAAIRRNPAHFDAYHNRALLLASLRRYPAAARDLLQCVQIRPEDPEPHALVGQLYETRFEGMEARAMEHYEQYARLGGKDERIVALVKEWLARKPKAAPTAPPTEQDETRARELHERITALIGEGKSDEALRVVDELLTKYVHTRYVRDRVNAFGAIQRALKPVEKK